MLGSWERTCQMQAPCLTSKFNPVPRRSCIRSIPCHVSISAAQVPGRRVSNGIGCFPGRPLNFRRSRLDRQICAAIKATEAELVSQTLLLEVAEKAAAAGKEIILEAVDKPRNIQFKGDTDLVTETDKASEEAILKVITEAFPDHAILGEEGGVVGNTASDYLWCVDPLDGTTNFAHGYPSFAVSIGVLRHATPVAAVVVEFCGGPGAWTSKTYTASRNGGAFMDGKPICVSRCHDLRRSLLATGFGYEHDAAWSKNLELFREFTDVTQGVRRLGAAAVDMCHVALGILDGYWEYRLKPWDMAAGVLIVEEAGGLVTTTDGLAFSVFQRSILASNGALHGAIQEKTEAATAQLRDQGVDLAPWFVPKGYRVSAGHQLE
eukprot:jgi/Botrbrau1/15057/Bobra.118_2s0005.1